MSNAATIAWLGYACQYENIGWSNTFIVSATQSSGGNRIYLTTQGNRAIALTDSNSFKGHIAVEILQ